MKAARAGKPQTSGRRKRRRGRVAPAELARLCSLPHDHPESLLKLGFTQKHIDDESRRLRGLHAGLYGRVVFPLREPGAVHAPPAGGNIGGRCCSHAWADEAWHTLDAVYPPRVERGRENPKPEARSSKEQEKIPRLKGDPAPPSDFDFRLSGFRRPPMPRGMRLCRRCLAQVPRIHFDSAGVCWDCHHEADEGRSIGTQRSGSLIDQGEMRRRH